MKLVFFGRVVTAVSELTSHNLHRSATLTALEWLIQNYPQNNDVLILELESDLILMQEAKGENVAGMWEDFRNIMLATYKKYVSPSQYESLYQAF